MTIFHPTAALRSPSLQDADEAAPAVIHVTRQAEGVRNS